jgi:hypothetical protein
MGLPENRKLKNIDHPIPSDVLMHFLLHDVPFRLGTLRQSKGRHTTLASLATLSEVVRVVRNNGMVAREPLEPARLSYIYVVFPPYLTLSSPSSARNIHSSLHPHTIAFICINHSTVAYAHILKTG